MMFVAYDVCRIMTFVANYDVCRLYCLSQYLLFCFFAMYSILDTCTVQCILYTGTPRPYCKAIKLNYCFTVDTFAVKFQPFLLTACFLILLEGQYLTNPFGALIDMPKYCRI